MVVSNAESSDNEVGPQENPLHPPTPSEKTTPAPSPSPLSSSSSSTTSTQSTSSVDDRSASSDTSADIEIIISSPIPLSSPPSFYSAISAPPEPPTSGAEDDVMRYNLAHGRGDTAVIRRLPESFPGYEDSLRSSIESPEPLPAYGTNEPPRYTRYARGSGNGLGEPQTLSRVFFIFGFFFPGLWFCGALMLITPFRSSNPLNQASNSGWVPNTSFALWCNEHLETDEEKTEFIRKFQAAERRWAKRCLLALFVLFCFGVAFGAMIYGILRSTSLKSSANANSSSAIWTS